MPYLTRCLARFAITLRSVTVWRYGRTDVWTYVFLNHVHMQGAVYARSRLSALVLMLAACLVVLPLHAQPAEGFELHDGDRVVFVGDGVVEHAQQYGYIEQALTSRWPEGNILFRNVGWSGDTVFGEARDHYTNPPTAFEHLIEQITTPRPTVIVFGYGGTLADESPEAIPVFIDGYHQLLDTLAVTGARCVLLAPVPHEPTNSPHPEVARFNAQLQQTRDAIERLAQERRCAFVDVFTPMRRHFRESARLLTTNGVRLNAEGYGALALVIEQGLTGSIRVPILGLDLASGRVDGGSLQGTIERGDASFAFSLVPDRLPIDAGQGRVLRLTELSRGTYTLWAGGGALHTASARAWNEGIAIAHPAELAQTEALRRAIIEKNQLYFRQYRPQNETYLVGFRRYEQGQNAAELDQLNPLIDEKENEIGRLRMPQPLTFTLRRE